ncbi:uncharacterized protein K460DRAFT_333246 [Cucurbitaria berberidis CBS 394.84]|uniref:Actin-like ATPase domain-containing protein n=1 Tax=Cucurbitaria berberidis CBS 394.84 TaxID=1168544 RepID=A0A9P4LAT6_9PLEO|nr:uncharacterized protein K460DRAFT_333246 [Cucurbitaria berberidis CBS 394.84]KAF1847838.1 hypothetical protein K460DRAFT_333246 [Cucurbitaria berberidis CBS 394.84]
MPFFRSLIIAFFSVIVCYFILVPPRRPTWLPLPMSKRNKQTPASTRCLALGISLTASYGTISIRHEDGSFEDIGCEHGDQNYLDMMQRFSRLSSSHPAPPYFRMEDQWDDQPRQGFRSARKLIFLPASSDVRTLSTLTSSLISLAKSHASSSSIASVVISYPALPGLYAEDISDTALYCNLPLLYGNHRYPPRTIVSTYTGNRMGLCSSYTDEKQCRQEGLALPVRSVILVEYTSAAVLLHTMSMREANDLADPDTDLSIHYFSLGDDQNSENVGRHTRRKSTREAVIELLRRRYKRLPEPPWPPKVITVLLIGSPRDIDIDGIYELVNGAVEEAGFEVEVFATNPRFVAARGAAELAWRALSLTKQTNMEL